MLVIVAHIKAVNGKEDFVKSELIKLIEPTLNESGCMLYKLHQDNNDPCSFLFYEHWLSHDLWQDHLKTKHLEDFKINCNGSLESMVVQEMTNI